MIRIIRSIIIPSFIAISFLGCQCDPEKANDSSDKKQLIQQNVMAVLWYQQSAEMTASYLQSYQYARMLLDSKLDTLSSNQPVGVVLDIDETVLDNSPNAVQLIRNDETYSFDKWKLWTDEARANPLPGALDFIIYAKEQGVEVFYISNRKDIELEATLKNLKAHNFPNADAEHVLLKSETSDKTARRAIVSGQVNVLLYLGDNLRDYSELFGNRGEGMGKNVVMENRKDILANFVIFPNPTYGEWEKSIYDNNMGMPDSLKLARRVSILED